MEETEALLKLTSFPGISPFEVRHLVDFFGSAFQAIQAEADAFNSVIACDKGQFHQWKNSSDWERELESAKRHQVHLISYLDPSYPKRLRSVNSFPLFLYVKGDVTLLYRSNFAIVGTRQPSEYGVRMARQFTRQIARKGYPVVSGLARGIDTVVHQSAIENGKTVAILSSGFNHIYPSENFHLAEKIAETGALVSEYSMNTPPAKHQFPQRNRTMAGIVNGALLIEAPKKSGSMMMMDCARKYHRRTFALPGPVDLESFEGNHYLLKSGMAELADQASDITNECEDLFGLFPSLGSNSKAIKDEEDSIFSLPKRQEVS